MPENVELLNAIARSQAAGTLKPDAVWAVKAFAESIVRSKGFRDADDIVQDFLCRFAVFWAKIDLGGNPIAYLKRAVATEIFKAHRKQKNRFKKIVYERELPRDFTLERFAEFQARNVCSTRR